MVKVDWIELNKTQKIILYAMTNSFKVIQVKRKSGSTTALLVGAILRLQRGLDTDIVSKDCLSALLSLLTLANIPYVDKVTLNGAEIRILKSPQDRYTLYDSDYKPTGNETLGLAIDSRGYWGNDHDLIRII